MAEKSLSKSICCLRSSRAHVQIARFFSSRSSTVSWAIANFLNLRALYRSSRPFFCCIEIRVSPAQNTTRCTTMSFLAPPYRLLRGFPPQKLNHRQRESMERAKKSLLGVRPVISEFWNKNSNSFFVMLPSLELRSIPVLPSVNPCFLSPKLLLARR
jgi:hypothetical protein